MPQAPTQRPAVTPRPPQNFRRPGPVESRRPGGRPGSTARRAAPPGPADKAEHEILFQKYFKSVGPRTYAAQIKKASNGNHYLVLTEGKRDDSTGEVRKTRLFLFSEDFVEWFKMLQATAQFIKTNPVPDEVKRKRDRYWVKKGQKAPSTLKSNRDVPALRTQRAVARAAQPGMRDPVAAARVGVSR